MNTEESRQIAQNPHTSPEVLRKLANSPDRLTRRNVAANPNIPTEVLWKLGQEFSQEILNNPILALLLLENPNLVEEIPRNTLKSILKEDSVPISFLTWAINQWDQEILLAIAMNHQAPKEILEKLIHSNNIEISEAGKLHVNVAGEMNEGWDEAAKDKIIKMVSFYKGIEKELQQLNGLGLISEFVILHLIKMGSFIHIISGYDIYSKPPIIFRSEWLIARNHNTPIDVLKQLANHSYYGVRISVALNPNSTFKILKQLANDGDFRVRSAVGSNPNTPVILIDKLVEEGTILVCHGVISNPNISVSILEKLLSHRRYVIRRAAAQKYLHRYPNRLSRFLEKLAAQKSEDDLMSFFALFHHQITAKPLVANCRSTIWLERYAIAQNPNTPTDILYTLAKDGNRIVRAAAKANLQNRH